MTESLPHTQQRYGACVCHDRQVRGPLRLHVSVAGAWRPATTSACAEGAPSSMNSASSATRCLLTGAHPPCNTDNKRVSVAHHTVVLLTYLTHGEHTLQTLLSGVPSAERRGARAPPAPRASRVSLGVSRVPRPAARGRWFVGACAPSTRRYSRCSLRSLFGLRYVKNRATSREQSSRGLTVE